MIITIVNQMVDTLNQVPEKEGGPLNVELSLQTQDIEHTKNTPSHQETRLTLSVREKPVLRSQLTYELHKDFDKDNLAQSVKETIYLRMLSHILSIGVQSAYSQILQRDGEHSTKN
jgi:hypothetical protein